MLSKTNGKHSGRPAENSSRRTVLKWSGAMLVGVTASGVRLPNFGLSPAFAADISTDIEVLNYAYALEQLEAGFYTRVVDTPYRGMSDEELDILTDLRDHEIVHREFLEEALGPLAIPELEMDFSAVDFSSRESVLTTARTFEDLGVAAYNGAGKLLGNPDYLLTAGRIVSVEARHAATIRDLLDPLSVAFAGPDVVDENGLDLAKSPKEVLMAADAFLRTPLSMDHLDRL